MKVQRRGNQVHKRRRVLKLHVRKITIAFEIAVLEMAAHAKPIVGSLQREMNVFAGLQFQDDQAAGARDTEKVEDTVFAARFGEYLAVDISRIKRGIDAGDIFSNQRFEPALWLRAIERMTRIIGQRMTIHLEMLHQVYEFLSRAWSKLPPGIVGSEEYPAVFPPGKRQAAKS